MFRGVLEVVGKEGEPRGAFDGVDCTRVRRQSTIHTKRTMGRSKSNVLGVTKRSSGASSGMIAFGRTNAPVEISWMSGVEGEEGLEARTTFAKWVGTAMLGGEPMTS